MKFPQFVEGESVYTPRMMSRTSNDSSIERFGRSDEAGVSDIEASQRNGQDNESGAEESISKVLPCLTCNSRSKRKFYDYKSNHCKNCKRFAQNHGKDEDDAPVMKFDDPIEAAKSSLWSTLGMNNEKMRSFSGFSQSYDPNGKRSRSGVTASMTALMANPAALSRSANFHESI